MNRATKFCLILFWVLSTVHCALAYIPGKFYYEGHTKEKVIALTFDDGPGVYTPKILEYLKQHHIRATFFIEGDQVATYPEYLRQERDAGHEIGNHTFTHPDFHKVKEHPADVFTEEISKTEAAIQKALGDPNFRTKIIRMPYGAYGKFNRDWMNPLLKEQGYSLVHWSFGEDWLSKKKGVEPGSWVTLTPEVLAADYIKNARPGAVFLMHDGGRHREKTWATLQIVVPALEQKGYRFVAAEDLFKDE